MHHTVVDMQYLILIILDKWQPMLRNNVKYQHENTRRPNLKPIRPVMAKRRTNVETRVQTINSNYSRKHPCAVC